MHSISDRHRWDGLHKSKKDIQKRKEKNQCSWRKRRVNGEIGDKKERRQESSFLMVVGIRKAPPLG